MMSHRGFGSAFVAIALALVCGCSGIPVGTPPSGAIIDDEPAPVVTARSEKNRLITELSIFALSNFAGESWRYDFPEDLPLAYEVARSVENTAGLRENLHAQWILVCKKFSDEAIVFSVISPDKTVVWTGKISLAD